jgi:hypothetical protein
MSRDVPARDPLERNEDSVMAWKQTGSFKARDSNGKQVTVLVFRQMASSAMFDDSAPGGSARSLRLETINGDKVVRDSKGRYHMSSGSDLTTDDPNAP